MNSTRHAPLLEDVKRYGAVVWEDLVARHPGSTRTVKEAVRRNLLAVVYMNSVRIISLGYQGRKHFGGTSKRPLSATTLLDQLAARLVTHHYESQGWIYSGQYAQNIHRFTHAEHTTEYALVKRSNYNKKHLERLALDSFRDVLHDHAHLIYYSYSQVTEEASYTSRTVTYRSILPILEQARPPVRNVLMEATV